MSYQFIVFEVSLGQGVEKGRDGTFNPPSAAQEEEDEDSDVEDLVFTAESTRSLHSRVTKVNGKMTMRGSVSEPVSVL